MLRAANQTDLPGLSGSYSKYLISELVKSSADFARAPHVASACQASAADILKEIKGFILNDKEHALGTEIIIYFVLTSFKRVATKKRRLDAMLSKQVAHIKKLRARLVKDMENFGHPRVAEAPRSSPRSPREGAALKDKERLKRSNYPKAVSAFLKSWLSSHVENPYPNEQEKNYLSLKTGLGHSQINNWFINARRRLLPHLKKKR